MFECRAKIAQHRVEVVLRIPGHHTAGERPQGRGRRGEQKHDRDQAESLAARPYAFATAAGRRRVLGYRDHCLAYAFFRPLLRRPVLPTTPRLVFGLEKGETVAAAGPVSPPQAWPLWPT